MLSTRMPRLTARSSVKCQSVKLPGSLTNVVANDVRKIFHWGLRIHDRHETAILLDENMLALIQKSYETCPSDFEISIPKSSNCDLSTTLGASVIMSNAF